MLRDFRLSVRPGAATTHNSSPSRSRHIRFNTQSIPSSEESRDYIIVILLQREKSQNRVSATRDHFEYNLV